MAKINDLFSELQGLLGEDSEELSEAKKAAKAKKEPAKAAKPSGKPAGRKGRPGSKRSEIGSFVAEPKAKKGPPSPHKHAFDTLMSRKVQSFKKQRTAFHTTKKKNEAADIAAKTKEISKTAKAAFIRKNYPDHTKKVPTLVAQDIREKFPFHKKGMAGIGKRASLKKKWLSKIKHKLDRSEKKRTTSHHTFLHKKGSGHPNERSTVTTARNRDAHSGFVRTHNPFKTRPTIGKTDFTAGNRGPRSVHRKGQWSCRKISSYTQMCSKLRDPKMKEKLAHVKAMSKAGKISAQEAQQRRAKIKKPTRMKVHINKEYKTKYDKAYKQFEKRKRHAEKGTEHHISAETRKTLHHAGTAASMHKRMKVAGSSKHIGKKYDNMPHHKPGKRGSAIPSQVWNKK